MQYSWCPKMFRSHLDHIIEKGEFDDKIVLSKDDICHIIAQKLDRDYGLCVGVETIRMWQYRTGPRYAAIRRATERILDVPPFSFESLDA